MEDGERRIEEEEKLWVLEKPGKLEKWYLGYVGIWPEFWIAQEPNEALLLSGLALALAALTHACYKGLGFLYSTSDFKQEFGMLVNCFWVDFRFLLVEKLKDEFGKWIFNQLVKKAFSW